MNDSQSWADEQIVKCFREKGHAHLPKDILTGTGSDLGLPPGWVMHKFDSSNDPRVMRAELIQRLTALRLDAEYCATQLQTYGLHPEIQSDECRKHAHELRNMAHGLGNWAASI